MNVDCGEDGEESMLGFIPYISMLETVVVEDTVVDPFCAGSVLIDPDPFVRSVGERAGITGTVAIIDIDDSSIG